MCFMGFPGGSDGKESACNAGDVGSIPGPGRYPGEGNGNPLQYSCLGNPMDREEPGGLQSMGSQKSQTWLREQQQQLCFMHQNAKNSKVVFLCGQCCEETVFSYITAGHVKWYKLCIKQLESMY